LRCTPYGIGAAPVRGRPVQLIQLARRLDGRASPVFGTLSSDKSSRSKIEIIFMPRAWQRKRSVAAWGNFLKLLRQLYFWERPSRPTRPGAEPDEDGRHAVAARHRCRLRDRRRPTRQTGRTLSADGCVDG